MGPDPKILDDIARLAGGAVNVASGLQQQIREEIKVRIEETANRMDLVPREDLEQALAMIEKQSQRISDLENRLSNLEEAKATAGKKGKK